MKEQTIPTDVGRLSYGKLLVNEGQQQMALVVEPTNAHLF